MNNFFNLNRFSRLFVKHTIEHYRAYLMSVAVLAGVITLGGTFLFFAIPEPPDPGLQTAVFVILLLIAGTIFTSTIFDDFGDKNKAIPAITLPATGFEKFMVGWLYSLPIFLLIYGGVFYLALFTLSNSKHWGAHQHFMMFTLNQSGASAVFIIYCVLHSVALFGAIVFKKLHFIKTGFVFFIGCAIMLICNTLFLKIITGLQVVKMAVPFGFLNFNIGDKYFSIGVDGPDAVMAQVVCMLTAIFIWVAAYYRLKEKQA